MNNIHYNKITAEIALRGFTLHTPIYIHFCTIKHTEVVQGYLLVTALPLFSFEFYFSVFV